jgi:hypothetical protein
MQLLKKNVVVRASSVLLSRQTAVAITDFKNAITDQMTSSVNINDPITDIFAITAAITDDILVRLLM